MIKRETVTFKEATKKGYTWRSQGVNNTIIECNEYAALCLSEIEGVTNPFYSVFTIGRHKDRVIRRFISNSSDKDRMKEVYYEVSARYFNRKTKKK